MQAARHKNNQFIPITITQPVHANHAPERTFRACFSCRYPAQNTKNTDEKGPTQWSQLVGTANARTLNRSSKASLRVSYSAAGSLLKKMDQWPVSKMCLHTCCKRGQGYTWFSGISTQSLATLISSSNIPLMGGAQGIIQTCFRRTDK